MVSTRRFGRFGNELYQLSMVVGMAKKHNLEWSMPRRTHEPFWHPIHFPNLFNSKWKEGVEDVLINEVWNKEQHFQEVEFKEEWRDKQVVLNGYWQSYKYWDFCRQDVLDAINFPWELKEKVVSIHVRRGDYLLTPAHHPVVTTEYLRQAVEIFREKKGIRKFKFFSDDITWCLGCGIAQMFPDCEFEYSIGQNEVQDLIEMSCHENQICSNSTLALWGAELNRNPRKVVVVPSEKTWFGPANQLSVKDLFRPEWIQVSY